MRRAFVIADGHSDSGRDLRKVLAADIFQREEHYDLAQALAATADLAGPERFVLENLLALKSDAVRDISAALFKYDENPSAVTSVSVPSSLLPILAELRPDVNFQSDASLRSTMIGRRIALTTVAKALLHRLYRLRRKSFRSGQAAIRAWVDVTLKMYPDEATNSQVRVFPFYLNRQRQRRFVEVLRERSITWSWDGLPYSFAAMLRVVLAAPHRRAERLAELEHEGFVRYAGEIIRADIGTVYTSDEFEVGAVSAGTGLSG